MNGIMDRIQICCFRTFCKIHFSGCCTMLGIYTHLQVFLCRICHYFTKQFCKFCRMLCLFISCFFPVKSDFRISFTVSHTCHRKVHTYFRTFSFEVCTKVCYDILANAFCYANYMLSSPDFFAFFHFVEFFRTYTTLWTFFWWLISFVNITAYGTYIFCHNNFSFSLINFIF